MKNILILLSLLLLLINIGCNKETEFGHQPILSEDDLLITTIQLEVSGFNNISGELAIAIFNNENSFESESEAYRDSTLTVTESEMIVLIENIDPGDYVISIFHDEDKNGSITFGGFLNIMPQEGFGFSNNPSITMSQPTYSDCEFNIEEGQKLIVPIELIYL